MKLSVSQRTQQNIKKLRKEGNVPAVIYGKYLDQNHHVFCNKNEVLKIYQDVWTSKPFSVIDKDNSLEEMVLLQDMQVHPLTNDLLHVDFLALKKGEKVKTEVVLSFIGEAPAKKNNIWRIQFLQDQIEVEALPKNLPKEIEVDLSSLEKIHDVVFLKDISIPTGVKVLEDAETPLCTVVEFAEEVVEEESTIDIDLVWEEDGEDKVSTEKEGSDEKK